MELIVRGLVALALIDCPDADVCPSGAAILIPDTSYFEKLGLHEHSATLSLPLAWFDAKHGGTGSYEVVDVGGEPMAVFALEPGEHFVLGSLEDLVVRPLRGEPVLRRSDASQLPLSQLLWAEELVEKPTVDVEHVRNVIWIRSGNIAARTLYGSNVVVEGREVDLAFQAPGAPRFKPQPLATEVVVQLPERGLTLERYGTNVAGGAEHWQLHHSALGLQPGQSRPLGFVGNLPKGLPTMPAADQLALNLLAWHTTRSPFVDNLGLGPRDPALDPYWEGIDCEELGMLGSKQCQFWMPWNSTLCPARGYQLTQVIACSLTYKSFPVRRCPPKFELHESETACVPDGFQNVSIIAGPCPAGTELVRGDGCHSLAVCIKN